MWTPALLMESSVEKVCCTHHSSSLLYCPRRSLGDMSYSQILPLSSNFALTATFSV